MWSSAFVLLSPLTSLSGVCAIQPGMYVYGWVKEKLNQLWISDEVHWTIKNIKIEITKNIIGYDGIK